jgi:hypothetical protein
VGIETAARGRPASAVSGQSRKPENSRIGAIPPTLATRETNPEKNCVAEQSDDFMKIKSENLG